MSPAVAQEVTAFAPASVGNVAIGFDILGFAVDALGDQVTVARVAAWFGDLVGGPIERYEVPSSAPSTSSCGARWAVA